MSKDNTSKLSNASELFRTEALDAQKRNAEGTRIISTPLSFYLLTGSLLALLVMFFSVLSYAEYSRKELVEGRLVPVGDFAEIYSAKSGVINQLLIEEGQIVVKGDPIALITSELYTKQGDRVASVLSKELVRTEQIISVGVSNEEQLAESVLRKLQNEINFKTKELQSIKSLVDITRKKRDLGIKNVSKLKELQQKKLISQTQYEKAYYESLSEEADFNRTANEQTVLESNIARMEAELEVQKLVSERNLTDLKLKLSETRRQLAVNKAEDSYLIMAPLSGVISGLQLRKGQRVGITKPLVTILPNKYMLEAELFIPTNAIGFVDRNTIVNIRYNAFPYQKFGSFTGKVKSISKNVVKAEQLIGYKGTEKWLYKMVVSLDKREFSGNIELQSGMELSAYVLGEKRTMFEWIFESLLSIKRNVI